MSLSDKRLRDYMIKIRQKSVGTLPERNFNAYQESRGMGLLWDKTLPFTDQDTHQLFDFQCDFLRPTKESFDIDFEIDGEKFHTSPRQRAKDIWKDCLKNHQGLKVIHIPAIITEKKWWGYLDKMIPVAVNSELGSVYIPA